MMSLAALLVFLAAFPGADGWLGASLNGGQDVLMMMNLAALPVFLAAFPGKDGRFGASLGGGQGVW